MRSQKEFAQSIEDLLLQAGAARATGTNTVNTISTPLSTTNPSNVFSTGGPSYLDLTNYVDQDDSQIPALEDIYGNSNNGIFTNASYDDEDAVTDFTNLKSSMNVSPIPTSKIHSIHHTTQILGHPKSRVQTRSKVNKSSGAHAFKISEALEDENLPYEKKAIGIKWVYRNKKDEREENVVAQLLTGEEIIESIIGINKDDIDEEDDASSTMEPPSRNEAIKAAITLNNFLLSY
ncbi:hypothetical protein Tco_0037006, partial [Tanacetum coccineum]